jgi:hypothetical protein
MEAAAAVCCQPVLVLTGRGRVAQAELGRRGLQQHWVASDLTDAVRLILRVHSVAQGQQAC